MKLPNMKAPCQECPFRKDSHKGWLGRERISEILNTDSFVCHKKTDMQCAGHMLISGQDNAFIQLAARLRLNLNLTGTEQIFSSKTDCINHHSN